MDWEIVYPVMLIGKYGPGVMDNFEALTTTDRTSLAGGDYKDDLLVDSIGQARRLKGARELPSSLGWWREFWHSSFLIRVELIFDSEIARVSVDELKERVWESVAGLTGLAATWNPGSISRDQLKASLKTAATFEEVFRLVREFSIIRKELR